MSKVGFGFLDRPGVREQLRLAAKAEALGYDSLWVTETRLARDAVSVLGAMAATTERVRLGSCIVNSWTRGPALMAMTFATLDNLAPGRMNSASAPTGTRSPGSRASSAASLSPKCASTWACCAACSRWRTA